MALFQPFINDNLDQEYHGDTGPEGFHGVHGVSGSSMAASGLLLYDNDPDAEMYSRFLASQPQQPNPMGFQDSFQSQIIPETVSGHAGSLGLGPNHGTSLSDDFFLNSHIPYSDIAQLSSDYNYQFAKSLALPSVSSSSSIPTATPDLSGTAGAAYDSFFPNMNTPQLEFQPQNSLLTSPLHGFNRHHSTTIPVDQLNLLSLKSMAAPQSSASTTTFSTDQVSKSPSPDYYYTSNNTNTSNSKPNTQDSHYDLNFDKLAEEMATFSKPSDNMVLPKNKESAPSNDAARTINPRELFTSSKIPTSLSSPALTTLYAINSGLAPQSSNINSVPQSSNFKGFSSSTMFTNIPNLPNQALNSGVQVKSSLRAPKFDFKMNDECYNAISYWLNNTLLSAISEDDPEALESGPSDEATKIMVNPTGIIKGNFTTTTRSRPHSFSASRSSYGGVSKRRNSIQLPNPSNYTQQVQALKNLDSQHMNEEDEEENDEAILDSSPSKFDISPPNVLSAGQKNKRRKSSTSEESNKLLQENPKLEASLSYAQSNSQPEPPRSRKVSSTPTIPTVDTFVSSSSPKKVILTSNSSSNSNIGSTSAPSASISGPVVPNAQGAFPCSECDKQFKRSEHLKRHIRSVHSNIRPFHCKYCDKKFSRSDNLAQHLKTHYRVDPNGQTTILYGNSTGHGRGSVSGLSDKKRDH